MKFPFRFQRGKTGIRATGNQAQNFKEQQQQNGGDCFVFQKAKNKKGENIFTADLEQSGVNGRASGVRSAARVIASVIDRHLILIFRTGKEVGDGG